MSTLRTHWLPLAVLVFAVLAFVRACEEGQRADRADREVVELRERVASANARAVDAEREARRMSEKADSLKAEMATDTVVAVQYITRWRTRVDTLPPEQALALADTTIAACERALGSCTETVAALDAAVAAQDTALARGREERDALRTYARTLEERLRGGDPIWTTPVAIGAGAGLGYVADGWDGALVGAGIGLGADIAWRGIRSLAESF